MSDTGGDADGDADTDTDTDTDTDSETDADKEIVETTVYLTGDSTVQTYSASQSPQQGWGQRLQEFFEPNITIVNKAMGGEAPNLMWPRD